jgi:hypothetical protein
MPKAIPDEEKAKQIGIRFKPEDHDRVEIIAHGLHEEGVPGMLTFEGEPILTNVIRYLLIKESERFTKKEEN